jgi:hypothetical protein
MELTYFYPALGIEENIIRLYIAMDNALAV